jgi:hypothetical protein
MQTLQNLKYTRAFGGLARRTKLCNKLLPKYPAALSVNRELVLLYLGNWEGRSFFARKKNDGEAR